MSTAEITTLTKQNQDLSHKVANLEQGISNAQKSLQRIEDCLLGNEEFGHVGMVKQLNNYKIIVQAIKQDVEDARAQKEQDAAILKTHKWWAAGIAAAVGGGIGTVFNYFFK